MKVSIKWFIIILLIAGAGAFGWYSGYKFNTFETKKTESSTVLLEKIKKVTQLVTVQGEMSEIYQYKEYQFFDLLPFRKKALIRVKAKVLVGFDIEDFSLSMDEMTKTITMTDLGLPSILAVDHDLDYYDITQGTFNSFSSEDYNIMNSQAKDFIEDQAIQSDLFDQAIESKEELYEMLRFVVENSGWNLQIERNIIPDQFKD